MNYALEPGLQARNAQLIILFIIQTAVKFLRQNKELSWEDEVIARDQVLPHIDLHPDTACPP